MFQALLTQLIHDARVSWKKSALLGVLLFVFLIVCLPPLFKAFDGGPSQKPSAAQTQQTSPTQTIEAETTFQRANPAAIPSVETQGWEQIDELLKTDPQTKSVEVAAIQRDPFRINRDQFPPPVLFEDEPDEELEHPVQEPEQEIASDATLEPEIKTPGGMVLKSTMIGVKRRAAFINTLFDGKSTSRLYFEGREVPGPDGEQYILTSIHPRKVVLTLELGIYELWIANDQASGMIEVNRLGQADR